MTDYPQKEEIEEAAVVEELFKLPTKNLESRIKQLEDEIKKREKLSNEALSMLGTHQLNLEEKLRQLRYVGPLSQGFNAKRDFESQILKLEMMKVDEMIACFRDLLKIGEKLQQAREEIEVARQKLMLVAPDSRIIPKEKSNSKNESNR